MKFSILVLLCVAYYVVAQDLVETTTTAATSTTASCLGKGETCTASSECCSQVCNLRGNGVGECLPQRHRGPRGPGRRPSGRPGRNGNRGNGRGNRN